MLLWLAQWVGIPSKLLLILLKYTNYTKARFRKKLKVLTQLTHCTSFKQVYYWSHFCLNLLKLFFNLQEIMLPWSKNSTNTPRQISRGDVVTDQLYSYKERAVADTQKKCRDHCTVLIYCDRCEFNLANITCLLYSLYNKVACNIDQCHRC